MTRVHLLVLPDSVAKMQQLLRDFLMSRAGGDQQNRKGKLMSREGSIHVADQILMMIILYLQRIWLNKTI